jgi:hypothetical protein
MSKSTIPIIVLFLTAALLRFADVFRPINQASWRECDVGAVSRNFASEGMNPLYPRIDWRGDGPGYAEMELPLYPWLTAFTYEIFGVHDQIGRVWAFLFSLGAMYFFYKLAREYLGIFASAVAFAFFAFNPLNVEIGTSIQPEGLMVFAYIAAVYYFIRWLKTDSDRYFWASVAATALTLLAKAPAAHVGLFFAILLINKYGWTVVRQGKVWIFGVLTLLPAALWYLHAKNLWATYGNSLGVSNEYHWVGWDFFSDPGFISGILRIEFDLVWVSFGLIVAAFAIWQGRREETAKHSLLWLASIFALYLIAARTTSQNWASYYHIFSVPPFALIFGLSIRKLWDYVRDFADRYSERSWVARLAKICVIFMMIASILSSFRVEARLVRSNLSNNRVQNPALVFANQIRPIVESDGLILVSGGHCVDRKGHYLAYNSSYMFYWLNKKGWNICVEDQSIPKVRDFASKGAKYFVVEKIYTQQGSGFEDDLKHTYPMLASSDGFALFDLAEGK